MKLSITQYCNWI